MKISLSVIICCYNSSNLLPETLRYIAQQEVSADIDWNLIIVDNNSSDNTSEVAYAQWCQLGAPVPMHIIHEPNPGLSNARTAGIKKSNNELILFCDDDNWLAPDYVEQACKLMLELPEIGILGGLNLPISSVALPVWFAKFETAYACGPQATSDGEVSTERLYITGAGMVIRKELLNLLQQVGFISHLTDRKGEELSSGGDTEICFIASILGYKLYYSSKLKLQHFLEPRRLSWSYLVALMRGHAKSYYKLSFYKKMYSGEKYTYRWFPMFWENSKYFFSRNGLSLLYHYFYKDIQDVENISTISRLWQIETWKAHFQMRTEYSSFIDSLSKLDNILKEQRIHTQNI